MIASLSADFDPADLQSDYRRDLRALLEAKIAGEEITRAGAGRRETPVIDLMEALKRSVAEAQAGEEAGRLGQARRATRRPPREGRKTAARGKRAG